MKNSILYDLDSYKASHYLQYPASTTSMFSYIESRGGKFDETVFFGLQYYIKEYLLHRVTVEEVDQAVKFYKAHGVPFNYDGWMYIAKELDGKLPVRIRAVPEGMVVPFKNILVSIESTDPNVPWIASWLETMLVRVWYSINTATISYHARKLIYEYLKKTCEDPGLEIGFKLHDFGSRGVSSQESAAIGGAAHLINFLGSDTIVGIRMANEYYNCDMAGFSIPAAEHSTITAWGRENEVEAYRNMLRQYAKPGGLLAVVSDSYDIYNAVENIWGEELRQEVIDSGATVVIRPDSGDPPEVVSKVLSLLALKFGFRVNKKGYKVLNHVRVIQGDGVNLDSIFEILKRIEDLGFSAENLAFGMGGGLLQSHNRDTNKFAMKCSSVVVDGKERDVFKDPVTDKVKKSKKGRLDLVRVSGSHGSAIATVQLDEGQVCRDDSLMETVYLNGELVREYSFDEVRQNTWG